LASAILCIVRKLNMTDDRIIVGGLGGVFRSNTVRESFIKAIRENIPNAILRGPLVGDQAILGPIIIAFRRLGLTVSEKNVRAVLDGLGE